MKALLTKPGNESPSRKNLSPPTLVSTRVVAPIIGSARTLQRSPNCACGGTCPRCRQNCPLRSALEVSQPDDPLELQANQVAEQVLAKPADSDVSSTPPHTQRLTGQATGRVDTAAPASVDQVLAGSGKPLDLALRKDMEQRFDHDFSRVRVHSGEAAEQSTLDVNAQAYTVGQNIVFGAGRFAPATKEGRRLIAHELTHVVQQSGPDRSRRDQINEARRPSPSSRNWQGSPSAHMASTPTLVQRAPKEGDTTSTAPDSPYSEEATVLSYAVGLWELGKLADGTVLYNARDWKATGLSNSSFVVGPLTSDSGLLFYVYTIKGADDKGTHTISRGRHLENWGTKEISPELHDTLTKVQGSKDLAVASMGAIPPAGGAVAKSSTTGGAPGQATSGVGKGPTAQATEASTDELTPHRKKWLTVGRDNMKAQIRSLFNSIQKLKAKRIDVWEKNARIKDPKPIRDALEVAVEVVGYGMGGVVGGLLTKSMAHGLLMEFVKESSLKSTVKLFEFVFEHAVEPAEELLNDATKEALSKDKEANARSALASKGDLLDCYVEAVSLQTISEEAAQNDKFNSTVDKRVPSDISLADEVGVFEALFAKLQSEPQYFLRELSVGVIRLKDEVYNEERAKEYGGDMKKMLEKDPTVHETAQRSGNLLVLSGPMHSLGDYWNPNVSFANFYALSTEVNKATLLELSGTAVKDLPLTLTFRFWASNPFTRWGPFVIFSEVLSKVWFEHRADGSTWVDFDEADVGNGIEWLGSYYLYSIGKSANDELSAKERREYAPKGAEKLYDLIKNKPIINLSNTDIF